MSMQSTKSFTMKILSMAAAFGLVAATATAAHHGHGDKSEEAKKSIAEIAAGSEQHTTLVSLLQSAGLVETLASEGSYTVFAPTNAAFEKVPQDTLQALGNNPDQLKKVLLYHVHKGTVPAAEVVKVNSVSTLAEQPLSVKVQGENVMINDAKVVKADLMASNGVVHVIDSVLIPGAGQEQASIVDIATSNEDFSTLAMLLQEAGLVGALQGEGPFTVFAPTNDAFKKLDPATVNALLANKDQLQAVLTYHVVPGKVTAADVVNVTSAKTLQGSNIDVSVNDGTVMVDGAKVVATDIMASNGVIHVIDSVIVPTAETAQTRPTTRSY